MKKWVVDYSIKKTGGEIVEEAATLEAENIVIAFAKAFNNIEYPIRRDPDVEAVAIWNIGIIAEPDEPEAVF